MPITAVGLAAVLALPGSAGASFTRERGTQDYISVSWTEYDPADTLRLPGNVHIGYLGVETGPYGTFVYGSVSDFDCEPGETPWGGHGSTETIGPEATDVATDAAADAVEAIIASGDTIIDADVVVDAVQSELSTEVPAIIEEEFEEFPTCDYIQDRFLEGSDNLVISVNTRTKVASVTGNLTVVSGGHGEPTNVLATPPIELTITGGDWEKFEYSSTNRSATYRYSYWQKGTSYNGGEVSGRIGGMGFDDDADDESYGYYSTAQYRTVERVR